MNIALFGSTGRVGRELTSLLTEAGQPFQALVRSPEKLPPKSKVRIIKGNVRNAEDVHSTIEGCSTIISCLNTDGDDTLTAGMRNILTVANEFKIKRIITVGTAGILQARSEPSLYRFQSNESKRRSTRAAEEHARVYEMLLKSDLDWTIACPTYLPDGKLTKSYRCEAGFLPEDGTSISVQDTAHFVYTEWQKHHYPCTRVGLAY
ncbi:NAD(P)H-binding protein [Metabacillus sp. KIGAM252]|uniref:NAD(P)H-binding protein n=1 Tax=Metabacillus flavus TaxID=2823519 RepID=A0ABS5LBU4_9BACI|nr:NAD(P)H-binding protein [Metabacillus flavus]MBS2968202.1 NAD(P)H-binding protein [Metabacillus flavus]